MTTPRDEARLAIHKRQPRVFDVPRQPDGHRSPVSAYFGRHVLDLIKLKERLPRETYGALMSTLGHGAPLKREVADAIASVARDWAMAHGATHFTHWFQPMTGLTAEKHDSFIDLNVQVHGELRVLERFSGSQLAQGEPDASSFPSGGMRSTFEARGYTAWDPSSPMFLVESANGYTLCIPSVFISYYGHCLDHKTPLLRSLDALSRRAVAFLKLLGDIDVHSVSATLGCEQEYFLIDRDHFALRPDLVLCERTLVGAASPRGQQFEDHYFGSIPPRVQAFMEEVEFELCRLGVPVRTRHNEVAPMQFEMAPIFEDVNMANDHNVLAMDIARKVALRHNLVSLFNEKPFAGLNGSGKHCNWSMVTDKGENLLDPGRTPHQNLRFLAFLAACMKAVHDHSVALRYSIANANNDLRLGANEAPPAILSVFVGDLLTDIIEKTIAGVTGQDPEHFVLEMGVGKLPALSRDNTDRNRTSPFAFTGNKFEFRAVGSAANCAAPVGMLNAAMADALNEMTERLKRRIDAGQPRDEAVLALLREVFAETSAIRFEGNNYSEEWKLEAGRRGLPNIPDTPSAIAAMRDPAQHSFLCQLGVLSELELNSRFNVDIERYIKQISLEAQTLIEVLTTLVLPAAEKQLALTASARNAAFLPGEMRAPSTVGARAAGATEAFERRMSAISGALEEMLGASDHLEMLLSDLEDAHDETTHARKLAEEVRPWMAKARDAADRLEKLVDDDLWPLPKYREMLFVK
jgi:glutamine synthetase